MMTQERTSHANYGVVDKAIAPHQPGRIKYQGSYWKAALADPNCQKLEAGEPVRVVGVQGITQLVVPASYEPSVQLQEQANGWWGSGRSTFAIWTQKFSSAFVATIG